MNKKILSCVMAGVMVACVSLGACAPKTPTSETGSNSSTSYQEGSLGAFHEDMGQDISGIQEISVEACSPCHGDLASIQADTEDVLVYEGHVGNPHKNHMSKEFDCTDCHNLEAPSVIGCNETCHQWELSRDNGTWDL